MNTLDIILGIVLLLGAVAIIIAEVSIDSTGYSIIASVCVALGILFITLPERNEPKAIDVYRDKTTLEITYRDSIPIDTTVVFKYK